MKFTNSLAVLHRHTARASLMAKSPPPATPT
jgi:hypothetical protein